MAPRKIGFGGGDGAPVRRDAPPPDAAVRPREAAGWRGPAAIVLGVAAAALLLNAAITLGGAGPAAEAIGDAMRGDRPWGDLLGLVAPPLLLAVAAWALAPRRRRAPTPERAKPQSETRPETRAGSAEPTTREPKASAGSVIGRILASMFLIVWLCGWTAGIVFAGAEFISLLGRGDGAALFMAIWLVFAVIGWFFAVRILLRLLSGGDLKTGA